ncbi:hypothetical protein BJX61DRAFT_125284 [Aspergillus egyptiacus]|nr:hypothetical protein BJX61DRAFT_125284 [Aspergillus egyptiacus]
MLVAADGAYYTMLCCMHQGNEKNDEIPGTRSSQPSFRDCVDTCSSTPTCQSVVYTQVHYDDNDTVGTCKLFTTGGFSTQSCGSDYHDYAYITACPAIESPEDMTVLCSTDCPMANGQVYSSKGGEVCSSSSVLASAS